MDILDAIDQAVGCQQCGGPLGDSPSDDFCSPEHQTAWHAQHADTLPPTLDAAPVYVEADHLQVPLREPGEPVGLFQLAPPGRGASRWTNEDLAMVVPCPGCGCTPRRGSPLCADCQRDHERLNWRLPRQTGDLAADIRACSRARDSASTDAQWAAVAVRAAQLAERSRLPFQHLARSFQRTFQDIRVEVDRVARNLRAAMGVPELPARTGDDHADARAAALHARRNRNTGPPPARLDGRQGARR